MSQEAWLIAKGISSIRPHCPEKTSKTCWIIGIFCRFLNFFICFVCYQFHFLRFLLELFLINLSFPNRHLFVSQNRPTPPSKLSFIAILSYNILQYYMKNQFSILKVWKSIFASSFSHSCFLSVCILCQLKTNISEEPHP